MSIAAKAVAYIIWLCVIASGGIYAIQAWTERYVSWMRLHPSSLHQETLGDPFIALLIGYGSIVIVVVLLLALPVWAHFANRTAPTETE